MAEETKLSRRARRRAKKEAEGDEPIEEAADESEAADDGDSVPPPPPEDDAEPAAEAAPKKKKKKRKKKAEAEGTEDIRDRNRRVREQAAARRRARRDKEKEAAAQAGLDTSEMVDDALARTTDTATKWIRANFRWVQWIVLALVAGGIGWQIYTWRSGKQSEARSGELFVAIEAERGRIGAPEDEKKPDEQGIVDPGRIFRTHEDRLKEAEQKYRDAISANESTPMGALAQLGLAGVLYDQGKYDDALAAYEKVERGELAKTDVDVRARAAEGVGLSLESKGDFDGALKAFRSVENTDVPGLKELGMYHRARVLYAQKKNQEAAGVLKEVIEKARGDKKPNPLQPPSYIEATARDLLTEIDPAAANETKPLGPGELDPEELKKLIEEAKKKGGGVPAPKPEGEPKE